MSAVRSQRIEPALGARGDERGHHFPLERLERGAAAPPASDPASARMRVCAASARGSLSPMPQAENTPEWGGTTTLFT